MSRFFYADELVIDLVSVSCVGHDYAIVGGVHIKLPKTAAYDLRRQFRVYKENADRKESGFKSASLGRVDANQFVIDKLTDPDFIRLVFGSFIERMAKEKEVLQS